MPAGLLGNGRVCRRAGWRQARRGHGSRAASTTSWSAPARPAACWPTACRPTRTSRVLLLEAGGKDDYPWIHIPVGYLYTQNNPRTDWCFRTEPEAGPRRARAQLSARQGPGRLLVDQRHDLHARPGGRLRPLAPAGQPPAGAGTTCCRTSSAPEDYVHGADEMHGAGGEWRVEEPRLSWEILDAFRAAAAEVGIPPTDDFNRGDNEGCGYFQVNQKRGVRWSTAKAFLRPARARPNLSVLTRRPGDPDRVRRPARRRPALPPPGPRRLCRGAGRGGAGARARSARRSCCSSPASARASCWRSSAFRSCTSSPGVGANLQDHLQLRLVYQVEGTRTLNEQAAPPARRAPGWGSSTSCSGAGR